MNYYEIYLFDGFRHKDIFPDDLSSTDGMLEKLSQMRFQEVGMNPRFERLGQRLADYADEFPVYDGSEPDEEYFWLNDPTKELACMKEAVWQPELPITDNVAEKLPGFLGKVLYPLARQLGLDIYDGMLDLYISTRGLVLGTGYEMASEMGFLDTERLGKFPDRNALSDWLLAHLTQSFEKDGFVFSKSSLEESTNRLDLEFNRRIQGGEQKFTCSAFKNATCSFIIESDSVRLDSIYKDIFSDKQRKEGILKYVQIAWGKLNGSTLAAHEEKTESVCSLIFFDHLLKCVQPAWKELEGSTWAMYEEEAAWRLADFRRYAFPILDRLKTVGGVDWWYNESNLPWETSKVYESIRGWQAEDYYFRIEKATIYAYLSRNPRADAIADDFEKLVNDGKSLSSDNAEYAAQRYPAVLDYCRSGRLKPVGRDEPA